jgi:hypothetical protein
MLSRIRACEGIAIVGADGIGEAVLLENGLKHWKSIGFLGGGERLAGEQVAPRKVGDGERIAVAPIGEHELALVIGATQIVGLAGKGKRCSLGSIPSCHSALDQAVAIENRMDRADRRRVRVRIGPDELDLRWAPAWLVLLEAHDPRLDLDGQLVGMARGPERVGEAVEADRVVAGKLVCAGCLDVGRTVDRNRFVLVGIINTDGKINLGIPTRVDEDDEIVLPPDKRTQTEQ